MSRTPRSSSPLLEALLDRLRGALVRQIWLHGMGSLLVATSLWLLFMYGADRWLHLPRALRLIHGVLLVALPLWIARRHIVKPLSCIPLPSGLARSLERAHLASTTRGKQLTSEQKLLRAADQERQETAKARLS